MEGNKTKLFWKPIDGEEFKKLECVAESDGFNFEPLEEPIDVKYDTTPVTNSFSFDMVLDKKQSKEIRKLFYCRIPRKKKKLFKKAVAHYHGCNIRDIKVSKYWGDYITKQYVTGI